MSQTVSQSPPRPPRIDPSRQRAGRGPGAFIRRHPWWFVGAGIVAFSTALLLWAGTRPGYDPYGWLVWGYQTLHLDLDLGGAPSWKPMPYLFTVPFSIFGHYALWLWMVTCVSVSLAGSIFAGRIAYRLTGADREHRYAAIAAALFAGLALLGIEDYTHYVLSVQSDPMLVTFCLAAVDCHLGRRYRWAFVFGVLASLGRPEAWPFLGVYSIWAWRRLPSMRWLICAGVAVVPALWFGVPTITNHRPLVAGQLAQGSPRVLHQNKVAGTLHRFRELNYFVVWLAALVAVALAALRRDRTVLTLAAGAAAWVVVEIAFALHGWPAVPRYMFEPAGVLIALAGVAVGWVLQGDLRLARRIPRWVGLPLVAVLVVALVPAALARIHKERGDLRHERERTTSINRLDTTIKALGGYREIRACGEPVANVEYVSILAWYMKLDVGFVGHRPDFERQQSYPTVFFTPTPRGWTVEPWHTLPAKQARCSRLHVSATFTPDHPGGLIVRR
jgi:hypothetical protein